MPRSRRTPTRQRGRASVDLILETAGELIVEAGAEALTTRAISERAGISVGTIYQYFRDREAVIATLLEARVEGMANQLTRGYLRVDPVTVRSLVTSSYSGQLEFYAGHPRLAYLWFHGRTSAAVRERVAARNTEAAERFRSILLAGKLADDSLTVAASAFAAHVYDATLQLVFASVDDPDRAAVGHAVEMISTYLERFATPDGIAGISQREFTRRLTESNEPMIDRMRRIRSGEAMDETAPAG